MVSVRAGGGGGNHQLSTLDERFMAARVMNMLKEASLGSCSLRPDEPTRRAATGFLAEATAKTRPIKGMRGQERAENTDDSAVSFPFCPYRGPGTFNVVSSSPRPRRNFLEKANSLRLTLLAWFFYVHARGNVAFRDSDSAVSSGAGTAGSGWREPNGTEFCALNLQPHSSLGATFATTMTWRPETFVGENLTAATFEVIQGV